MYVKSYTDRYFTCQSMNLPPLTGKSPVSESKIIHWQVKCLSVTYFPATDRYFTCQSENILHWQVIYLSVRNFQITSFKRGGFEEININNHKPKSFLSLVEDAHKDSVANRGNISSSGYMYTYIYMCFYTQHIFV